MLIVKDDIFISGFDGEARFNPGRTAARKRPAARDVARRSTRSTIRSELRWSARAVMGRTSTAGSAQRWRNGAIAR